MKTKNRLFALLLTLCMALSMTAVPAFAAEDAAASGTCGANVTWSFDQSTGTLTISGTGPMYDYDLDDPWGEWKAPWRQSDALVKGIKNVIVKEGVTSIGMDAFAGCTSLTSVTLPNSLTSIGESGFSATSLPSVTIPGGVTSIGDGAFYNCKSLTSVTIPDSVTGIDGTAFFFTPFLEAKLKENPLWIHGNSLVAVSGNVRGECDIPSGVTSISDHAFCGFTDMGWQGARGFACYDVTSVTIPDGVTSIGDSAFKGCFRLTSVTLPDSLTSIGDSAFSQCPSLTSATIPDGVTSIGESAFFGTALTSVTIPSSVTSIGPNAFDVTPWLEAKFQETPCWIYRNSLIDVDEDVTECVIPDGVTSIGGSAFQFCTSLTSVTIPDSVTSIGDSAFDRCTSLTSVTIPDSVTSIGEHAFYCCYSLTSVTLPDGVTSVEDYAFTWCSSLTSVTLSDSVTHIGAYAFESCESLTSVTIENPDCEIYDSPRTISSSIDDHDFSGTIYGYDGSTAQEYAEKHGKSFKSLGGDKRRSFTDVPASAYYADAVKWAVANGVTNGTSATTFSPDVNCTQAQIITFLYRAMKSPAAGGSSPYSDYRIESDQYFYAPLLWAASEGVVTDMDLDPWAPCTRADAVTYMWRVAGSPAASGGSFDDVAADAYYAQAVAWAVANGVTNGTGVNTFSPDDTCTRAQIVTFLYRWAGENA